MCKFLERIRKKKCLCGLSLRVGTIIIALSSIVYFGAFGAMIIYLDVMAFLYESWLEWIKEHFFIETDVVGFLTFQSIFAFVRISMNFDLLYGAIRKNTKHIIPFLIITIILIIVRVTSMSITLLKGQAIDWQYAIVLVFDTYFLMHVSSFYLELDEMPSPVEIPP